MKTAIVTGASSGVGRAVALRMLSAGWRVGLIARRSDKLADIAGTGVAQSRCPVM